jgi:hypothetical protein
MALQPWRAGTLCTVRIPLTRWPLFPMTMTNARLLPPSPRLVPRIGEKNTVSEFLYHFVCIW